MKSPLPILALIASLAPLSAAAQNAGPPDYTFGMFPNMFGNSGYTVPPGYMNQGQSPFMTMPAPQYPYANPQFPNATLGQTAPFPANPMAQPTPFWMQTPTSPQRYITDVPNRTAPTGRQGYILDPPNLPSTVSPRTTPPNYTVFRPPGFSAVPPRWAPLPGQGPVTIRPQGPTNNWSTPPNGGQAAPAIPATPPKWPTP